MANFMSSILRKGVREKGEPLNILTAPTHEACETLLTKTGHNFYAIRLEPQIKNWDIKYRPVPENYYLLNKDLNDDQVFSDIDIDLILSQHKFGQFQLLSNIAKQLHAPHIHYEHTMPLEGWTRDYVSQFKQMKGDLNIFISEFSRSAWLFEENEGIVIPHGIDTDFFKPKLIEKNGKILSVVNDWINRDRICGFSLWKDITNGLPVLPIGNTPGLSEPAKTPEDLLQYYQECSVFINTSLYSPIPMSLLEAMSAGCACVSTATAQIPNFIQHGYNGYISNNPQELRQYVKELLSNPEMSKKLGENARFTIQNKYSVEKYIKNWNDTFEAANEIVYKGV